MLSERLYKLILFFYELLQWYRTYFDEWWWVWPLLIVALVVSCAIAIYIGNATGTVEKRVAKKLPFPVLNVTEQETRNALLYNR